MTPAAIGPAREADADRLSRLAAATFPLACPPSTPQADIDRHIRTELGASRFRELLSTPGIELHVADDGGVLVGYLMIVTEGGDAPALPGNRPVELRRIYVDPSRHGRGVADALMARAVDRAREHGADCLWLGTNQQNARALSFYRRHGFTEIGTRTFRVGSSIECDFVLARSVADPRNE